MQDKVGTGKSVSGGGLGPRSLGQAACRQPADSMTPADSTEQSSRLDDAGDAGMWKKRRVGRSGQDAPAGDAEDDCRLDERLLNER